MPKKHLFLSFLLLLTMMLSAQETSRLITGVVTDKSNGEALPGATIMVQNTMRGAMSNLDGEFTYQLNKNDIASAVLKFSFVGYETQEITVGEKNNFIVALKPAFNSLNEVVITSSYGNKRLKQEVVGSISNIKAQDIIVEAPATSIDQLLEGQSAGLQITSGEGIDSPSEINIRGVGSLPNSSVGTSTQPLIIVDGVILSEEIEIEGSFETNAGTYSEDPSNPLAKIGIDDIESINILKDAAAVSLYGANGANGVIIITTKGGTPNDFKITAGLQSGISSELDPIIYMNGQQYSDVINAYKYSKGELINPWNGVSTDWHDLLNNNGYYQKYNLAVSGGKDKFNYRISGSYQDVQEPQINNTLDRITSSIALAYTGEKLNISWKLAPSYSSKQTPNTFAEYALPPNKAAYNANGSYNNDFSSYGNPIAVANQNQDEKKTYGLRSSFTLNYNILDNLSFTTFLGNDITRKTQDRFFSGENESGISNDGLSRRLINKRIGSGWNWNAVINYDKVFADLHNFDATVGIETLLNKTSFEKSFGVGFDNYKTPQDISLANKQSYGSDSDESTGRSLFAQFNYNYNKKYFVLVNTRLDQSSAFGDDRNTSLNSAIGASWAISQEDFLKGSNWIKHLKIRSSYGSSGNSRIGSYRAKGLYSVQDSESSTGYNGSTDGYATPYSAPNPDLGWESNYKFDAGIDLVTRYRLGVTLDFFNDNIRDMIVSRTVPYETGYSSVQINGANMYNRGIELSLSYKIFDRNNFRWKTNFNISTVKNEITSLTTLGSGASQSSSLYATQVGKSSTAIWGYNFVGVDPATGRELYDVDGRTIDNVTFKNQYQESEYREIIGNSQPDMFGGLNNNFTLYKYLSLRINFSYQFGGEKFADDDKIDKYNIMAYSNIGVNAYYQAWRTPGDLTGYGMISERGVVSNSSKYLYSTSHIKLGNVSLTYRFPLKNNDKIKSLNMNINGSNLYYWFLQESPDGQNGIKELYKTYSDMRSFTLGINASF